LDANGPETIPLIREALGIVLDDKFHIEPLIFPASVDIPERPRRILQK